MGNFTLGKYLPLDSVIHKMDPRAKIGAMLLMLIAIFIPSGYLGYALIAACLLFVILKAKLSLKFVTKAFMPIGTFSYCARFFRPS